MLLVEISTIPVEGLTIDEPLDLPSVHLAGEDSFVLRPGGRLACRLERVDGDSVHLRGRLSAGLGLECNRCLGGFDLAVDHELDLFYLPHAPDAEGEEEEDEVELGDHEMVVAYHDGSRLDLGEMVREQLYLTVPMKRLCREDCKGRCPRCGQDLNASPCACPAPEAQTDPRLAALKKLFPQGSD
ncbi:MAG TPA: DUF177 domain-containing protein [Vicinamibacteria bacterium]